VQAAEYALKQHRRVQQSEVKKGKKTRRNKDGSIDRRFVTGPERSAAQRRGGMIGKRFQQTTSRGISRRLSTKEAVTLMQDYWDFINAEPTNEEVTELLRESVLQGESHERVMAWFVNRRNRRE
jgi:hypothetical protein